MKIVKSIDVQLNRKRPTIPIDVVQYDTGVQIAFTLVDFTPPTGAAATMYVQKPSGKFVYQETGITVSGNVITVDLKNQALAEHGNAGYQVKITSGTDTISTFAGLLRVEKSLSDANAVESQTVIAAFEEKTAAQIAEIEAAAEAQITAIQNLYNTYATKNEAANAIKGQLSGAVVFADDVSPVEHNPVVKVYGKNLLPNIFNDLSNWATANGTVNNYVFPLSGLKVGVKYTISAKVIDNSFGYFYLEKSKNGFVTDTDVHLHTPNNSFFPYTFVVEKDFDYRLFWYDEGHSPFDFATNFQLEEGENATEYTAFDPTSVTVRRCGKNLLQNNDISQTTNGISFVVNRDGTVNCNGTATDYVFLTAKAVLNKGRYILSGCPTGGAESSYSMICYDGNNQYLYDTGNGVEFEVKQAKEYIFYLARFCPNTTARNLKFLPMVRALGVNAEFEPYNGSTHIPAADGTVSGITSLSPNMTILTDTDGAIVECEYIKDSNKVIEKLTNAIIALGGTV